MTEFYVFGNFGLEGETALTEAFPRRADAIEWANRYTARDSGGYTSIDIVQFAPGTGFTVELSTYSGIEFED